MKNNITLWNITKLAGPAVVFQSIIMFVGLIDVAFVGRLANATFAIAAVTIANNICVGIYSFLEGIRTGTTVLTARFCGAKQSDHISRVIKLALIYAIVIGTLLLFFMPFLIKFLYGFTRNSMIESFGFSYLSIRIMALPFVLIIFAITGFFSGLKSTLTPMLVTLFIGILNAIFNYLFLHGTYEGLHGISSIARATFLSYVIGSVIIMIMLFVVPATKQFLHFKHSVKPILKEFTKLGIEIGFYFGIVVVAMFLFSLMFFHLGEQTIAAHQIVLQIFMASYLASMGFFIATTIIIGKILGAKDFKHVLYAVKKLCKFALAITTIPALTILIFAKHIANFFSPQDPIVAAMIIKPLYAACAALMLSALFSVLRGALTATKDTKFIAIAGSITSYLVFLPISYLLGIKLGYGIFGGYIAFTLWFAADTTIYIWRFGIQKPWAKKITSST